MNDQEVTVVEPFATDETVSPPVPVETNPSPTESLEIPVEPASSNAEAGDALQNDGPPSIHNLQIGQHLTGKVKNIAEFGAFVDIGIPQDGLVHISELSKQKVEKVTDVVSQGQEVEVWVKKIDAKRGRISLTMVKPVTLKFKDIDEEAELDGVITRLEPYGAFVDIGADRDGLVHISQITYDYIKHPQDALNVGDQVKVKILKVNRKKRQIDLSIKALLPPPPPPAAPPVEEVRKVEEGKRKAEANVSEDVVEEEIMPTAMATAFAALQGQLQGEKAGKSAYHGKDKNKHRKELDAIIARTLSGRN